MKKKLAGLLAALLVLTMGTTVFAAQSPNASDVENQAAAVEKAEAATVTSDNATLTKSSLPTGTYKSATVEVQKLGSDAQILAAFELTATNQTGKAITVKISVPGIKAGDSVRILHFTQNTWVQVTPSEVGDGYVVASFESLSPIVVVKTASAGNSGVGSGNPSNNTSESNQNSGSQSQTNGSNTLSTGSSTSGGNVQTNNNNQTVNIYTTGTGASTSTTSPKTGASLPALPIIAILAVMGIAVCGKKARSL